MQQPVTQGTVVRACGIAVLAMLGSAAWAGNYETADARVAAARSLFTAPHAISAHAPAARQAAQDAIPAKDSENLDLQRGGTDTVNNDMRLDGSVANNNAVNVVTGNNVIDAGSFANMSGIPVVIQNTGANVLIQNATIINLQFK